MTERARYDIPEPPPFSPMRGLWVPLMIVGAVVAVLLTVTYFLVERSL